MDGTKLAPFPARLPPEKADFSPIFMVNKTGPSTWVLNAAPHEFRLQNVPPMIIVWKKKSRAKTSWGNSNGFLRNGSVVDLIIENSYVDSSHPFHKHNHKVWIIGIDSARARVGSPGKNADEATENGGAQYLDLMGPALL